MSNGFRDLNIYNRAHQLGVRIHAMTLGLPRLELFEEGSQIRRSSKSVSSQIVEGYCLRKSKAEFIHYLTRAHASSEETIEHLDYLSETGSLKDKDVFNELRVAYTELSKLIFRFIQSVYSEHDKPRYIREDPDNDEYNIDTSEELP